MASFVPLKKRLSLSGSSSLRTTIVVGFDLLVLRISTSDAALPMSAQGLRSDAASTSPLISARKRLCGSPTWTSFIESLGMNRSRSVTVV